MKIAVIGASGNAGSRIVAELARRGHIVTAIARNPERIAQLANVTAKQGDIFDAAAMATLLAGHDAAISSIHFLDSDPEKLIGAAKAAGLGRYLVVGGAGSLEVAPGVRLVTTPTFPAQKPLYRRLLRGGGCPPLRANKPACARFSGRPAFRFARYCLS
jgi:putative NADH-flavin reductase